MSPLTLLLSVIVSSAHASTAVCVNELALRAARDFYGDHLVKSASVLRTNPHRRSIAIAVALNVGSTPLRVYAVIRNDVVRRTGILPFVARDWMNNRELMARQPDPAFVGHLREIITVFIKSTVAGATNPAIRFYPVTVAETAQSILALAIARFDDGTGHEVSRKLAITEHAGRLVIGDARDVIRDRYLDQRQHLGDAALNEFFADTARRSVKVRRLDAVDAFAGVVALHETVDAVVARVAVTFRRRGAGPAWLTDHVVVRHSGIRVDVAPE